MAKSAKKAATVRRKYTKKAISSAIEQEPGVARTPTIKEEIIDILNKRHIQFVDKDGHLAISTSQMVDGSAIVDLIDAGVQAFNARVNAGGPYIAIYY